MQSAVHSPGSAPEETYAQPRARAREGNDQSAQSQPKSAPDAGVTLSDYSGPIVDWVKATFTPPDVVTQDSVSLKKRWAYARHGEWTAEEGLLRTAGMVWALTVAIPAAAAARYVEWILERPSRTAAAVVLLFLLSRVPPLKWLI